MSLICPRCGAENRPHAKFCLKCAKQLVVLNPAEAEAARASRRRQRRRHKEAQARAAAAGQTRPDNRWLVGSVAGALVLVCAVWWGMRSSAPSGPAAGVTPPGGLAYGGSTARAPAESPAPAAAAAGEAPRPVANAAPEVAGSAAVLTAAAAASAALNTAPVAASKAADAAPHANAAPTPAQAAPKAAARTGKAPADKAHADRSRANAEKSAGTAAPTPSAPSPTTPPPTAPAPVAASLCSDRAFIGRAVCLQSECSKPALRQHPSCVRMREQQEALRNGSGGG